MKRAKSSLDISRDCAITYTKPHAPHSHRSGCITHKKQVRHCRQCTGSVSDEGEGRVRRSSVSGLPWSAHQDFWAATSGKRGASGVFLQVIRAGYLFLSSKSSLLSTRSIQGWSPSPPAPPPPFFDLSAIPVAKSNPDPQAALSTSPILSITFLCPLPSLLLPVSLRIEQSTQTTIDS